MNTFKSSFNTYRSTYRSGHILIAFMLGFLFLISGFILLGIGDIALALNQGARVTLAIIVLIASAVTFGYGLLKATRISDLSAAKAADDLSGSGRREISNAASLNSTANSPLQEFLNQKVLQEAESKLKTLTYKDRLPIRKIKHLCFALVAILLPLLSHCALSLGLSSLPLSECLRQLQM